MFEILYRITDKNEYLKSLDENSFDVGGDVEGFFLININDSYYGHYHCNPLGDDEMGWHSISNWFINLATAYKELCQKDYVAINDTESYNTWLEFKKNDKHLLASIIEANKEDGATELRLTPFIAFNYGEWDNIAFEIKEYHDELILKISAFLNELEKINKRLLGNKNISVLTSLLAELNSSSQ